MRKFFTVLKYVLLSSYIKGFIGLALFYAAGYYFVDAVRNSMGLPFKMDPGVVLGAILGLIGFLLFAGVLTDWIKWCFGKRPVIVTASSCWSASMDALYQCRC